MLYYFMRKYNLTDEWNQEVSNDAFQNVVDLNGNLKKIFQEKVAAGKMTRRGLSVLSGISETIVYDWISGRRKYIQHISVLSRIAKVLGYKIEAVKT